MQISQARLFWGLVGVVVVTGCGTPVNRVCVPGKSDLCAGLGACAGGQRCNDEGTGYGPCECAPAGGGGGATGGGGGTGGGEDAGEDAGANDGGDSGVDGGGDGGTVSDAGFDGGVRYGQPDIEVHPSPTLDLGRIAFFAGASPPSWGSGTLFVQNVGPLVLPAARQNLKLGQPDGLRGYVRPYWVVTAQAGSSLSEICVGVFDTATSTCTNDLPTIRYDPDAGLVTQAPPLEIPVRITPTGLGTRAFELKLYSNDPDEPVTTISVTANAVSLPPCDVEILPTALPFGVVTPPSDKDLSFAIRNRLTGPNDLCLISNFAPAPEVGTPAGMSPVFQLPAGGASLELPPGETKQVVVRAHPRGVLPAAPAQVSGKVVFTVAGPTGALRELPLTATVAASCLIIAPSSSDFGTVKKDCNSPDRSFQLYNACSSDVVIDSLTMVLPAGEASMGPNCPSASPCPEFHLVGGISTGTRVLPGSSAPVTFSLKYRPINVGTDLGAFALQVTQGGQQLDYVVPLHGKGDPTGSNTDTFMSAVEKADVLLVIDDSCSMSDKQAALAANMSALLDYATTNQIDFQLGVTNTELSGSTAAVAGTLHTSDGGIRILRPGTPNLAAEFASLVNVGTSGYSESCMDPATRALTAPNINDPAKNAGFLRDDASLSVVCITDARDQAPQMPSYYLNQLLNVKGSQGPGFTYNVMGPFLPSSPSGCSYDDPNDGRHEFMVTRTGGVKEEICTTSWSTALQRIGATAFGYHNDFFLTARPDLAAATGPQVTVNGVSVPELDPTPPMARLWEYDATNNRIVFQPLAQPPPGAVVTVTYLTPCIP